jgi:hypothetical protein
VRSNCDFSQDETAAVLRHAQQEQHVQPNQAEETEFLEATQLLRIGNGIEHSSCADMAIIQEAFLGHALPIEFE